MEQMVADATTIEMGGEGITYEEVSNTEPVVVFVPGNLSTHSCEVLLESLRRGASSSGPDLRRTLDVLIAAVRGSEVPRTWIVHLDGPRPVIPLGTTARQRSRPPTVLIDNYEPHWVREILERHA